MAVSMAAFTTNDSITKVVSSEMNFGQVMLVRGLFAILLVAAFAWHQGALRPLRTLILKPVALRVFGEIGGTISFMAALAHLPLANTSAIFQALPLAITLGAAVIFGEPVGWRRWSAIVAGFIGVLIIVRPGLAGFSQYSLFALVSVAFCALRDLATRGIPAKIPSLFITLLTTVTVTTAGGAIIRLSARRVVIASMSPISPKLIGDGHDSAAAHLRNIRKEQGRVPHPLSRSRRAHHANQIRFPDRRDVGNQVRRPDRVCLSAGMAR